MIILILNILDLYEYVLGHIHLLYFLSNSNCCFGFNCNETMINCKLHRWCDNMISFFYEIIDLLFLWKLSIVYMIIFKWVWSVLCRIYLEWYNWKLYRYLSVFLKPLIHYNFVYVLNNDRHLFPCLHVQSLQRWIYRR